MLHLCGSPRTWTAAESHHRTVYGRVSRGRLNTVLQLYDFPDPMMSAPQRDLTTSPLQHCLS